MTAGCVSLVTVKVVAVRPLNLLSHESICEAEALRKMPGSCQRPLFLLVSLAPNKTDKLGLESVHSNCESSPA